MKLSARWTLHFRAQAIHRDDFGRPELVEDVDGVSSYIYDGPGDNELGRLVEATSAFGQTQTFGFEARGQTFNRGLPNRVTSFLTAPGAGPSTPARELTTTYHFDEDSRLEQVDYPVVAGAPVGVKYEFDAFGHTIKAKNATTPSQVYWQLVSAYQGHRIAEERLGTHTCGTGQGSLTTRSYEALTGRLHSIETNCGSQALQGLTYGYDAAGNLTTIGDASTHLTESHGYDALNRLITYSPGGGVPTTTRYQYDAQGRGRLDWQANVGDYTYSLDGRDWIESAGTTSYAHDGVGNITSRVGPNVPGGSQQIAYSASDLPTTVTSPGTETDFAYDGQGRRVVKKGPTATTFYAGDAYQVTDTGTAQEQRFMIYAAGRAVAQLSNSVQGTTASSMTTRYLHDDVLGSVRVVSNTSGGVASARSFQPFGQSSGPPSDTPYGFTGHEGDDDLGLINMKGRMYDPSLSQFLSADPIISQPYGQGLNRFAYVNNSPLNFTDPSGFSPESDDDDESGYYIAGRGGSSALKRVAIATGVGAGVATTIAFATSQTGKAAGGAIAAAVSNTVQGASSALTPTAASGVATVASFASSVIFNDALFTSTPRTSKQVEGFAAGGGKTGATPGRGAVAPDAISPIQEHHFSRDSGTGGAGAVDDELGQEGRGSAGPRKIPKLGRFLTPTRDGWYQLTTEGLQKLRPLGVFNYDFGRLRFRFSSSLGSRPGVHTGGNDILLNSHMWDNFDEENQVHVIAHEATHVVQEARLGVFRMNPRHRWEELKAAISGVSEYTQSVDLQNMSIRQLNPVDPRFTLESIADKVGDAAIGYGQ